VSSSEDTSSSDDEEPAAPPAAAPAKPAAAPRSAGGTGGKSARPQGSPFQRVDASEWLGKLGGIGQDNSYAATFGDGGYGAKAQQKLGVTRGKGFRAEKTKAKRGSYRGGAIDGAVNSIKFEEDSD
jgi:nucleolin